MSGCVVACRAVPRAPQGVAAGIGRAVVAARLPYPLTTNPVATSTATPTTRSAGPIPWTRSACPESTVPVTATPRAAPV